MSVFIQTQKNMGKITLSMIALIAILGLSFGNQMTTMAQNEETYWAGTVTDVDGKPLPALVTINGERVQADEAGYFALDAPATERNVINAEHSGYGLVSYIHIGSPVAGLNLQLQKAQRFTIAPGEPVDMTDERGTSILIEPDALVNAEGLPAESEIYADVYTYDLAQEPIPGDMLGMLDGEMTAMISYGSFHVEFVDERGNRYNLAPGMMARISVPLPESENAPEFMPLWSYDENQGLWIAEAEARLEGDRLVGEVSHFSAWNFDDPIDRSACLAITVDPVYLAANAPFLIKVVALTAPPQVRYLTVTDPVNVLYGMAANIDVEVYVPSTSSVPYTITNTGSPWSGSWSIPPYTACNGSININGSTPIPTPTPIDSDLGDAPDSTNNFGIPMTTMSGTMARYPVVFNDPFGISGPIHWNSSADVWLGSSVDSELDADLPPTAPTNIDPSSNSANQDDLPGTTGILASTFGLPPCGMTTFQYEVTVVGPLQPRYTNAWIDFNGDGDWEDSFPCGGGIWVNEWIVANQMTTLGPGVYTITTPPFNADMPGGPPVWMRLMLSEGPAVTVPVPSGADGRGPIGGYNFGETEDYLTDGVNIMP